MNGEATAGFVDIWLWLIFIGFGLFFIILELVIGVATGYDLVFIGSAFILGGLISWPFQSWIATVVVTSIICVAYVVLGRRYMHRRMTVPLARTNVDAIVGKTGVVTAGIGRSADGRVRIETEDWKARSDEALEEGEEIIVTGVNRNTLIVRKTEGGN